MPSARVTDCSAVNRPSASTSPSSRPSTQSSTTHTRPDPSTTSRMGKTLGWATLASVAADVRRRTRKASSDAAAEPSSVTATASPVDTCLAHDTTPVDPTAGASARA